jgi:hypothetical protein
MKTTNADAAADQITQDAVALTLAMLNALETENTGAFDEILRPYGVAGNAQRLVVTLTALALQLGREDQRTDDQLRASLIGYAGEIAKMRQRLEGRGISCGEE